MPCHFIYHAESSLTSVAPAATTLRLTPCLELKSAGHTYRSRCWHHTPPSSQPEKHGNHFKSGTLDQTFKFQECQQHRPLSGLCCWQSEDDQTVHEDAVRPISKCSDLAPASCITTGGCFVTLEHHPLPRPQPDHRRKAIFNQRQLVPLRHLRDQCRVTRLSTTAPSAPRLVNLKRKLRTSALAEGPAKSTSTSGSKG